MSNRENTKSHTECPGAGAWTYHRDGSRRHTLAEARERLRRPVSKDTRVNAWRVDEAGNRVRMTRGELRTDLRRVFARDTDTSRRRQGLSRQVPKAARNRARRPSSVTRAAPRTAAGSNTDSGGDSPPSPGSPEGPSPTTPGCISAPYTAGAEVFV